MDDLFEFFPDPSIVEVVMKGDGIDYSAITEISDVSGILLQFLYQLPEPIITYDLHDSFVSASRMSIFLFPILRMNQFFINFKHKKGIKGTDKQKKVLKILIKMLPALHEEVLKLLLGFLG